MTAVVKAHLPPVPTPADPNSGSVTYPPTPSSNKKAPRPMKTLWDKGAALDAEIAAYTVGDDRRIDANIAAHDVLGSLAHVATLRAAGLLTDADADALTAELRALYTQALAGELAPGPQDEDIHSAVERLLGERVGAAGRRVHTARSRNDQVATDVSLWLRDNLLAALGEALDAAEALAEFAQVVGDAPLPGMTHLQPAMPSTFALWSLAYASLLADDAGILRAAFTQANACPLGSAAGYGVPGRLAPIDRHLTAKLLAFARPIEPVTAVQAGRGKAEAAALFALTQCAQTCSRLAADVVLYVNPHFGWLSLPDAFTTGSSIMPQKKNPDVMELVRGHAHVVQAALSEVLSLPMGLPGGYHRDFQLLKAPTLRGVAAARSTLRITAHVFHHIEPRRGAADASITPELYATRRALQLVVDGVPFRDAYQTVAAEVRSGSLPVDNLSGDPPPADEALAATRARLADHRRWHEDAAATIRAATQALVAG
jgi:argininosuccinate lyase